MYAQATPPLNLDLGKVLIPVLLATFVPAAIWFYHKTYFSSSREPTSQTVTVTTRSSSQEPDYSVDDQSSLRKTEPLNLKFPTTTAQLTRKPNNQGFDLQVVRCKYQTIIHNITEGNKAILVNPGELPYRFPVDAIIDRQRAAWSTRNLGLLTRQLQSFWLALGGGQRCTELTIQLPSVRLDEVTNGTGILAFTTEVILPPNLETLKWIGHREQLPMFFQHQPGFSTLANLTIHSTLSMDDCKTLLYWGRETLQSVAFWTIRNVDPGDVRVSLPPAFKSVQNIQMTALRSLTIASTLDIRPLYSPQPLIRFPELKEVTLKISNPAFKIRDCWRWLTMGGILDVPDWNVHCHMSREQESRMKERYPNSVVKRARLTLSDVLPPTD